MKIPSTPIAIVLIMCAALNPGARAEKPDLLSREMATLLQLATTSKQGNFQYENGHVISGGKKMTFAAVSERALEHQGQFIQAARVEVSVDGVAVPALTFGSIGMGKSREEADKMAILEWYMAAGKAVIEAVGRQKAEIEMGGFSVYPGHTGIRGTPPEGWLQGEAGMHPKILKELLPHLPKDASTVAIDLKMTMQPGSALDGQCLINGQSSEVAVEAMKRLDWPRSGDAYMFKQAYVLVK